MKVFPLFLITASLWAQIPEPIIFVHGNGDDATKWVPAISLWESNGYPANHLFAIRFTDPVARSQNSQPEPFRSSTTDQASELSAFVARVLLQTKSKKVVLVGSSRGGMTIRNYLKNAGGAAVASHAILCGTPNHGVMASDTNLDQEFNGRGTFLRELNEGSEVVSGVKFMTLRSDKLDKYAQPNVGYDGPALKGADNVVLPNLDHRELAFQPLSFARMYRFVTGKEPDTLQPIAERTPVISGLVTGFAGAAPTNRPLAAVALRVFVLKTGSAEREGAAVLTTTTSETGAWGPLSIDPQREYEFVLEKNGHAVTYFMTGLLRSTTLLNLRFLPDGPAPSQPQLLIHRPQGYFSQGRDPVTANGVAVQGISSGVPVSDSVSVPVANGEPVHVQLRGESIYARPATTSHAISVVELQWD